MNNLTRYDKCVYIIGKYEDDLLELLDALKPFRIRIDYDPVFQYISGYPMDKTYQEKGHLFIFYPKDGGEDFISTHIRGNLSVLDAAINSRFRKLKIRNLSNL